MTVGLAAATANSLLDALGNATNYTAPTQVWIKLHTGDPGASATANAAGNDTRKQASFSAAASGAITTDTDLAWSSGEVDTSEDYTHYSAWTASTGGTFLWSGVITANAVVVGDQFKILAGDLDMTFNLAG